MQYSPNQFSNCQLIRHTKEVGTQGEMAADEEAKSAAASQLKKERRRNDSVDSNGFQKVCR